MCQVPLNKSEYISYKAFYVATQSLKNAEVFELNSCPISKSSRKFYEWNSLVSGTNVICRDSNIEGKTDYLGNQNVPLKYLLES